MDMTDLHDRTMLTPLPITRTDAQAHHAAVCNVLRSAKRVGASVDDVRVVCAALGLDLDTALNEA